MIMGLSISHYANGSTFQIIVSEMFDDKTIRITANMSGGANLNVTNMKELRKWLTIQIRKSKQA